MNFVLRAALVGASAYGICMAYNATVARAEPIRLTLVDTQAAALHCLGHMRPANVVMFALLLSPPAACAVYSPGRCTIYAPLSGPATALAYLAFETPDSLLAHEWMHCSGQADHHPAALFGSER